MNRPHLEQTQPMSFYHASYYNARWWIKYKGHLMGGYSANDLRSYVFPLYSPKGALVLQEAPPDHPHHQGITVGLHIDGQDFWAAGSFGRPRHQQGAVPELRDLSPSVTNHEVRLEHVTRWVTTAGDELLRERRIIRFSAHKNFNMVEWQSQFSHPDKKTYLDQTKEAGIGLRVPPHWETSMGGQIRDARGRLGERECFDHEAAWLNVQGPVYAGQMAGVVFIPMPRTEPCPWFTRDYGLHLYNPLRHHDLILPPEQSFTWAVRILAYDGVRSIEEIEDMIQVLVSM